MTRTMFTSFINTYVHPIRYFHQETISNKKKRPSFSLFGNIINISLLAR